MLSFRSSIRPLLVITFILIVWLDFIVLPVHKALSCGASYEAYTTDSFWLGMGSIVVTWVIARTTEKLKNLN